MFIIFSLSNNQTSFGLQQITKPKRSLNQIPKFKLYI